MVIWGIFKLKHFNGDKVDFTEVFRYGWILISGVFVWLFKNLDSQWKGKIDRLEKESDATKRRLAEVELEIVKLEAKKITREDLDKLMSAHFNHFEKALDNQRQYFDQRFDDIKESIANNKFVEGRSGKGE